MLTVAAALAVAALEVFSPADTRAHVSEPRSVALVLRSGGYPMCPNYWDIAWGVLDEDENAVSNPSFWRLQHSWFGHRWCALAEVGFWFAGGWRDA